MCYLFQDSAVRISLPLLNHAYNFLYYFLTLNNIAALIQLILIDRRSCFILNFKFKTLTCEINKVFKISVNKKCNQNSLVTLKKLSTNIIILQNFVC